MKFYFFILAIMIVISCSRCKEECMDSSNPDCPNYIDPIPDPCLGVNPISADFIIEQRLIISNDEFRETNTVFGCIGCGVRVRAKQPGLQYQWQIGQDIYTDSVVNFVFSEDAVGGTYPITLITQGTPNLECNPNDNGLDTIVKYINVKAFDDNGIEGNWRIAWDSAPLDSFDVSINAYNDPIFLFLTTWENFTPETQNSPCEDVTFLYGYNFIRINFSDYDDCLSMRGDFWVNPDGTFEADYEYRISAQPLIFQRQYARGRRLQ